MCSCVIGHDEVDKEVGMDVDQESGQEVQVVRIENELCQSDLELTDQTNVGQLQVTSSAQKIPGFGDNSRDSIWQSDSFFMFKVDALLSNTVQLQ